MQFKQPGKCGICGSAEVEKIGSFNRKPLIICLACGACWWNTWRTREAHIKWMEKTEVE